MQAGDPLPVYDNVTPTLTLRDTFIHGSRNYGPLVALYDEELEKPITYTELHLRTNKLARALAGFGLQVGDHVSVISENTFRYVEAYGAILKLGGVCCPVAHMFADNEIINVINSLESRIVFVQSKFAELFSRIRDRLTHVREAILYNTEASYDVRAEDSTSGYNVYEQLMADNSDEDLMEPQELDERSNAILFLTSGTTGTPKAAMLSHKALMQTVLSTGKFFAMPGTTICLYNSFAWVGACGFLFTSLANGGRIVILNGYTYETYYPAIVKHKATIGFMLPQQMKDLLRLPAEDIEKLKESLQIVAYGGGVVPVAVSHRVQALMFPKPVIQGYGMTEMFGLGIQSPAIPMMAMGKPVDSPQARMMGSQGKPGLGVTVRVIRPDHTLCEPNEAGEVVARGPTMMSGYYKRPEATTKTLLHGWMHTGDVGYQDENGNLFINSRVKDMINMDSGYNVYPVEIENVIAQMEGVAEVAVVGISDDDGGNERPVAAVVRTAAGASITLADVLKHCVGKLADFKHPVGVAFMESLPHNPNGKVLKTELRVQVPAIMEMP